MELAALVSCRDVLRVSHAGCLVNDDTRHESAGGPRFVKLDLVWKATREERELGARVRRLRPVPLESALLHDDELPVSIPEAKVERGSRGTSYTPSPALRIGDRAAARNRC